MKGFATVSSTFLRFTGFVLIISLGFGFAADFAYKLTAGITNWWISSALSSLVCAFLLVVVLTVAIVIVDRGCKTDPEPGQLSSSDSEDTSKLYLISALCLIVPILLIALVNFSVLNLIHLYPHHWWMVLPLLVIGWRLSLSHLNLIRLDKTSAPASDLRLSGYMTAMVSKSGLKDFDIRVRNYPALYASSREAFAAAKMREPEGLKHSMVKHCCAYSFKGRNVVLMCPVTIGELNEKEVDSIIAHEIGHLKLGHYKAQIVLCVLGALSDMALTLLVLMSLPQLCVLTNGSINPIAVLFIYMGMSIFTHVLSRFFTRQFERRADEYAIRVTGDPQAFRSAMTRIYDFRKVGKTSQVRVFDSHPPFGQRIAMADRMTSKEAA